MNKTTTCPDREILAGFLAGDLTDQEIGRLEVHLSQCPACGDTVRAMHVDDTMLGLIRTAGAREPEEEEQREIAQLLDKLERLPLGGQSGEHHSDEAEFTASDDLDARVQEVQRLLAAPERPDEIGRLAHFRLLKLLGAGGMGVVFQAEDIQLQRLVALKVLRPSLGPTTRQRFLQEARAAAAIDHDHVITTYHVGNEGPLAFLAMQWLDGETLEARLRREQKLTPDEVREIGSQIADGLAAAHAKRLIHRDIKPANVWLEADRQRARILDFGLARAVDDTQLTETGMMAGTPAYMSPEQARGDHIDERTDLFSLGTMLYRMLTGRLPFDTPNALAAIRAVQQQQPPTPRELDAQVPAWLSQLVMWLLEKDREERLAPASAVAQGLRDPKSLPRRQPKAKVTAATQRSSARWRVWLAAAILLAMGGSLAAPAIYRILTPHGKLVIKSDDPDVQVNVLRGGEVVEILDSRTNAAVKIAAGEYDLQLKGDTSGVRLSPQRVSLTRNGREVVSVLRVQQENEPKLQGSGEVSSLNDLLNVVVDPETAADYKIAPGAELRIEVLGTTPGREIKGVFVVEPKGTVKLGPGYSRVNVAGLTLVEAEAAIRQELRNVLKAPEVMVVRSAGPRTARGTTSSRLRIPDPSQPLEPGTRLRLLVEGDENAILPGGFTVLADGSIRLPFLGRFPNAAGMTIDELQQELGNAYEAPGFINANSLLLLFADASANNRISSATQVPDPSQPLQPGVRLRLEYPGGPDRGIVPREFTILADGSIRLPYIGRYENAAGQTIEQLAIELSSKYAGIFANPEMLLLTFADPTSNQADSPPVDLAQPPASLYDGKTYDQWLQVVQTEKKPERLAEALQALAALTTDQEADATARVLFQVMRIHGNHQPDASAVGNLASVARTTFWTISPKAAAKAIERELDTGNRQSHAFLDWVLDRPPTRNFNEQPLLDALAASSPRICSKLVLIAQLDTARDWSPTELIQQEERRRWAVGMLAQFCSKVAVDTGVAELIQPILAERLNDQDHQMRSRVAEALVKSAPQTEGLAEAIVDMLQQAAEQNRRASHIFGLTQLQLLKTLGPRAAPAVPLLIELLSDDTHRHELENVFKTLGAIGPAAKAALPALRKFKEQLANQSWLDSFSSSLASGDRGDAWERLVQAAEDAITQIEASPAGATVEESPHRSDEVEASDARVEAELERLVEIAVAQLNHKEQKYQAGTVTEYEVIRARIAFADAQVRLAEVSHDRKQLGQSLEEILSLSQQLVDLARDQHNAGIAEMDRVFAAEKEALEAQLRIKKHVEYIQAE